jgi:hypothetical protein
VVLGLPFLSRNKIIIDHNERTVIRKLRDFGLLNLKAPEVPKVCKRTLKETFHHVQGARREMVHKLKEVCRQQKGCVDSSAEKVRLNDVVGAIRARIEGLAALETLKQLGEDIKNEYCAVFKPIHHLNELLSDVYCRIQLKDAS